MIAWMRQFAARHKRLLRWIIIIGIYHALGLQFYKVTEEYELKAYHLGAVLQTAIKLELLTFIHGNATQCRDFDRQPVDKNVCTKDQFIAGNVCERHSMYSTILKAPFQELVLGVGMILFLPYSGKVMGNYGDYVVVINDDIYNDKDLFACVERAILNPARLFSTPIRQFSSLEEQRMFADGKAIGVYNMIRKNAIQIGIIVVPISGVDHIDKQAAGTRRYTVKYEEGK